MTQEHKTIPLSPTNKAPEGSVEAAIARLEKAFRKKGKKYAKNRFAQLENFKNKENVVDSLKRVRSDDYQTASPSKKLNSDSEDEEVPLIRYGPETPNIEEGMKMLEAIEEARKAQKNLPPPNFNTGALDDEDSDVTSDSSAMSIEDEATIKQEVIDTALKSPALKREASPFVTKKEVVYLDNDGYAVEEFEGEFENGSNAASDEVETPTIDIQAAETPEESDNDNDGYAVEEFENGSNAASDEVETLTIDIQAAETPEESDNDGSAVMSFVAETPEEVLAILGLDSAAPAAGAAGE